MPGRVDVIEVVAAGPPRHFELGPTFAGGVVFGGRCLYFGHALAEYSGASDVEYDFYDSTGTGLSVAWMNLNLHAAESDRLWLGPQGLLLQQGLYIFPLVGLMVGSVWVAPAVPKPAGER